MQATQSKPTKGNTMNDGVMFIVLSQKQTELGSSQDTLQKVRTISLSHVRSLSALF